MFQARSSLASSRAARDTPCDEIREQLATLSRHLHDCPGCRRFREKVSTQRRELALLIPVAPTVGLKQAVLSAVFGAGGSGAGSAAVAAGGLFATALVAIAIPAGGIGTVVTGSLDERRALRTSSLGARTSSATAPPEARATAVLGPARVGNAPWQRSSKHTSAHVVTKAGTQNRERPARAQATSNERRPETPAPANHDQPQGAVSPPRPSHSSHRGRVIGPSRRSPMRRSGPPGPQRWSDGQRRTVQQRRQHRPRCTAMTLQPPAPNWSSRRRRTAASHRRSRIARARGRRPLRPGPISCPPPALSRRLPSRPRSPARTRAPAEMRATARAAKSQAPAVGQAMSLGRGSSER
jgi:hypothetical protein